jgi:hypothetical protein
MKNPDLQPWVDLFRARILFVPDEMIFIESVHSLTAAEIAARRCPPLGHEGAVGEAGQTCDRPLEHAAGCECGLL